ncbi:MAG: carbon-nitrogen hydrolase family protein [Deltaproteobacteria bacterium]|nr:carbon-nitrogen hydrolase family protein [Deltaproteobacteria bacterium]
MSAVRTRCAPRLAVLLLAGLAAAAAACATPEPAVVRPPAEPQLASFGHDQGLGNILAIQPYLEAGDYATTWDLGVKLEDYLRAAQGNGWLGPQTVVVFPESIGSYLFAVDEAPELYRVRTQDDALDWLVNKNLWDFASRYPFVADRDRRWHWLFNHKAPRMARAYQGIFSRLARNFHVTIVAGSIVLPDPLVDNGALLLGSGRKLHHVSLVYDPEGKVMGAPVREIYLSTARQPFIERGTTDELGVYATPAGKLGVLVGADSFYPRCYELLRDQKAEIVVAVSALPRRATWDRKWPGYDGFPAPNEFARDDAGAITEREARLKYGLPGLLRFTPAKIGVDVYLHGQLWDVGYDGQTLVVMDQAVESGPLVDGPALTNVWLSGVTPTPTLAPLAPSSAL